MVNKGLNFQIQPKKNIYMFVLVEARQRIVIVLQKEYDFILEGSKLLNLIFYLF